MVTEADILPVMDLSTMSSHRPSPALSSIRKRPTQRHDATKSIMFENFSGSLINFRSPLNLVALHQKSLMRLELELGILGGAHQALIGQWWIFAISCSRHLPKPTTISLSHAPRRHIASISLKQSKVQVDETRMIIF